MIQNSAFLLGGLFCVHLVCSPENTLPGRKAQPSKKGKSGGEGRLAAPGDARFTAGVERGGPDEAIGDVGSTATAIGDGAGSDGLRAALALSDGGASDGGCSDG